MRKVKFSIDNKNINQQGDNLPQTLIHREDTNESPVLCIYAIQNDGPAELTVKIIDAASTAAVFTMSAGETHHISIRTDQSVSFQSPEKITGSFELLMLATEDRVQGTSADDVEGPLSFPDRVHRLRAGARLGIKSGTLTNLHEVLTDHIDFNDHSNFNDHNDFNNN